MTADNVIRLPVRRPSLTADALFAVLTERIARLERIEQTAQAFVEHVQARETAGWRKVPQHPSMHGAVGLEQLVEALEA